MKKTIPLIIAIVGLAGCSNYKDENKQHVIVNNENKSLPYLTPYLTATKSPYQELICDFKNTWESYVFLIGWRESKDVDYDLSKITPEQKKETIQKGTEILKAEADKKSLTNLNSTILANYYLAKYEYKEAIFWAFKGAESGSASCMHLLGQAYVSGDQGVVQDFEEGLKWIYLGAALGEKSCKKWVNEGIGYLFTDKNFKKMILAAQKNSTSWMKEHSELFASSNQLPEKKL